ncbi:phosphotransferase family protein [Gayadomonas joobiniege]|uniref:phosphotransferase family protein n=1 Tax=Gayadomonas joobiniege TaxID=1234606 RepID=UPI0003632900|nr:phosphotransferase [Gayadomonas joobiniege]
MLPAAQYQFLQTHFNGIQHISRMPVHSSNLCLKVKANTGDLYFVKYYKAASQIDNIRTELALVNWAAKADLGISSLHFDSSLKLAIFPFLQATDLASQPILLSDKINRLACLLARLHQVKQAPPKNLQQQKLLQDLKANSSKLSIDRQILALAKHLDQSQGPSVVCHGDASFANILCRQTDLLIDWEYARLAPVEYDLASAICINQLSFEASQQLLEAYQTASGKQICRHRLKNYQSVFQILNQLWYKQHESGYTRQF